MKKGKQLTKVLLCVAVCALFWFFEANTAAAVTDGQTHCAGGAYVCISNTPATCTKSGKKIYKCNKCNAQAVETLAQKNHSWNSWTTTKAATCGATGTKQRSCTYCGKSETETIPATGNHLALSGATCTSASICKTCGTQISGKLGHSWGSWKITKEPTCGSDGMKKRTCTRSGCGAKEEKKVSATGKHVALSGATCTSPSICKTCGTQLEAALKHSMGEWVTTKEPTCANPGTKQRTCTRGCGTKETGTVPATGNHVALSGATCTSPSICKTCGTQLAAALKHSMGEWVTTKEPTCANPGTKQRTCTRGCGTKETGTVPATGNHVAVSGATCTNPSVCRTCGKVLADKLDHIWGEWTTTKAPTCGNEGTKQRTCTLGCGTKEMGTVPATGKHVAVSGATCTNPSVCRTCGKVLGEKLEHIWGEWTTTKAPTCANEGTKQRTCTYGCGTKETGTVPATGNHVAVSGATCTNPSICRTCGKVLGEKLEHIWGEWTTTKAPTCVSEGEKKRTCTYGCGTKETGMVPATGKHVAVSGATCTNPSVCRTCGKVLGEKLEHIWGEWKIEKDATCTSVGTMKRTCTRNCGTKETQTIDKKPHVYETITIAESCITDGLEQERCDCGKVKSSKVLPMLGHDWKDWVVLREETCEQDGERKHTCKRCNITLYETIKKLEHEYSNGSCIHCKKFENYEGIKVTFDANGGAGGQYINAISVIPGETYGKLPAGPTRAGYTFDGWYTAKSGGTKVTASTKVTKTSAHTLYAHWTAGKYTIQFYGNGNTAGIMNSITVNFGEKIKLPKNTFKKTGYIFAGWNEKADGTGKGYLDETSVENLTTVNNGKIALYAQWVEGYYTINYDANGGTGAPSSHEATIGKTVKISGTKPTREGYEFVGWSLDMFASVPDYQPGDVFPKEDDKSSVKTAAKSKGEVTLYAVWPNTDYTVTFYPNGGEGDAVSRTVAGGEKVLRVPEFGKTGYKFVGWSRSMGEYGPIAYEPGADIVVTSDMNLYARWAAISYTVSFDLQGGTANPPISSRKVNSGRSIYLSFTEPKKEGYVFKGWSWEASDREAAYQPGGVFPREGDLYIDIDNTKDVKLYAIWERAVHTVTFYPNGGAGDLTLREALHGYRVDRVPEFSRPGYKFVGWSRSMGEYGPITYEPGADIVVTSDMNLYARWAAISYTVSFDLQGGTANPPISSRKVNSGRSICLSFTEPKKEGYVFKGWSWEASDREGVYQPGGAFPKEGDLYIDIDNTKDVKLYAIWEQAVYTVTYYSDKGKIIDTKSYLSNTEMVLPEIDLPKIEDDYYTRLCWVDVSEGGDGRKYDEGETVKVKGNMEFKVGRKEREYKITYDLNGGTWGNGIESQTIKAGDKLLSLPTKPSRKYYEFVGWSTQEDLLVTYQPGDVFPNENGFYYDQEKDMEKITLHAVWTQVVDFEMVQYLQKQYGESVMLDGYFVTERELSNWIPLGNGEWGIIKTTADKNMNGCTYYHSDVFVMKQNGVEGAIDITVYGSYELSKENVELCLLEWDPELGSVAISVIRVVDIAAANAGKRFVSFVIPGGSAILLGQDALSYFDDDFFEFIQEVRRGEKKLADPTQPVVIDGVSFGVGTIQLIVDFFNKAEIKSGEKVTFSYLLKKAHNHDVVGGTIDGWKAILEVIDIWSLYNNAINQDIDPNGTNDVVAAYVMDMMRKADFNQNAIDDTINALANIYEGK